MHPAAGRRAFFLATQYAERRTIQRNRRTRRQTFVELRIGYVGHGYGRAITERRPRSSDSARNCLHATPTTARIVRRLRFAISIPSLESLERPPDARKSIRQEPAPVGCRVCKAGERVED